MFGFQCHPTTEMLQNAQNLVSMGAHNGGPDPSRGLLGQKGARKWTFQTIFAKCIPWFFLNTNIRRSGPAKLNLEAGRSRNQLILIHIYVNGPLQHSFSW